MSSPESASSLHARIADTVGASQNQVIAAIGLLDGGATVPFIARYRKEVTGGLSDTQLRLLEERLTYLRELDSRRDSIIKAIDEQGKLDAALRARIDSADSKSELEDLYLPYRKKRRSKGLIAIEAGLEPLAEILWQQADKKPDIEAGRFINPDKGIDGVKSALDGALYILIERFAEDAVLIAKLRKILQEQAFICSSVVASKHDKNSKFSDYFDHQEPYKRTPGHRALAMFRGRSEGVLSLKLLLRNGDDYDDTACIQAVAAHLGFNNRGQAADEWRARVVAWTWKIKVGSHLENELLATLRTKADVEAIGVFAANLKDLLLAAPAGPRPTLGLDPGFRTGVKVVVVNATGKPVDHTAIFPHPPKKQWQSSLDTLAALCRKHSVELIAIGNGTASRETERLADELISGIKVPGLTKVVVSEAGASVYSASELAEQEFPDLDVTIRGAISIARRLQDPLAELVKIDAKAIGVGQYQHDVSQSALANSLQATVEDCVNAVGVDLGTASAALLSHVAGLSPTLAENVVSYRDEHGAFSTRKTLTKVPRLGPKAFEQAAGFLRINNGSDPLDASGVHPEAYPVVKRIVAHTGQPLSAILGNSELLNTLDPAQFTDSQFGIPTVKDILVELDKPGRDPRPEFRTVRYADGVDKMTDLLPNQVLEGQVTNVTAFGTFVDIGVHQDGLVHISAMSDSFVKDPRDVVKTGDIVKVKVMGVEVERKRIALSMRLTDEAGEEHREGRGQRTHRSTDRRGRTASDKSTSNGFRTKQQKAARSGKAKQGNGRPSESQQPSALAMSLKAALEKNS